MGLRMVSMGEGEAPVENVSRETFSPGSNTHHEVKQNKKKAGKRSKYWGTIIYPDNANLKQNYMELIKESRVPCIISPCHDKDTNEDGSPKKPHYHAVFAYSSLKSQEQFKEFVEAWGGVGAEIIQDMSAYVPYLWHEGETDKAQYNPDDCTILNGFEMKNFVKVRETKVFQEITRIIDEFAFTHIDRLMDYLAAAAEAGENGITEEHFAYVRKNSYMWVNYLKAKSHRELKAKKQEHDEEFAQVEFLLARLKQMGFDRLPADFTFEQLELKNV